MKHPVLICVTARTNSKRLPIKAILKIKGKTTIEHLLTRLFLSGIQVCLCTTDKYEDDELYDISKRMGIYCVRGSEKDVLGRIVQAINIFGAKHIIRVTGDDIFTDIDTMIAQLRYHIKSNADYTSCPDIPKGMECEIIKSNILLEAHEIQKLAQSTREPSTEMITSYIKIPELYNVQEYKLSRSYSFNVEMDTKEDFIKIVDIFDALYPNITLDKLDEYFEKIIVKCQ